MNSLNHLNTQIIYLNQKNNCKFVFVNNCPYQKKGKYKMFLTKKYKQLIKENNKILNENNNLLKILIKRVKMMDVTLNYKQYWTEDNLQNIIPLNQGEFPEGFNPGTIINEILNDKNINTIVDFGCGYGRLSRSFSPDKYIGIDLNPNAIKMAKENNPEYNYLEIDVNSEYPKCDAIFAHTVFLHNDNTTLKSILKRLENTGAKYIIISDVISKDWHNGFIPPTFYRDLNDYNSLMENIGFKFISETKKVYKRYADLEEFKNLNTDLSFLLYKRK